MAEQRPQPSSGEDGIAIVILPLPDLYRNLKGQTLKRFAWSYIKTNYPDYDPIKEQTLLHENKIILVLNIQRARERRERLDAIQAQKKKRKKKGK